MKRLCTLILALVLGMSGSSIAGPDPGMTKKIVNKNNNPDNWQWAPVWLIFDDNFRDQVLGEVVIATLRAFNDTTSKFVKLHTDALGNLKVMVTGASTVTVVGPLGTRPAAQSVSTAPPTDARYQVSKDANVNSVSNTIWTTLSNGAAIIGAAVGAPLYVSVSKNTAANALTNPIYTQLSQDGTNAVDATHPIPISQDMAANAVTNPLWFQVSQDGTNAVDATHPIPISQDMGANLVTNPLWFQISQDGTSAVDATHPIPISQDMAANALTNPLYIQVSQDGTSAVDATHPIPISQDMAANALTNPLYIQVSQDGTSAVDATHPIPISDDMGANALDNTIKVELSDGTNAFFDNVTYPGYARTQDGDSTELADVEAAQADGKALTLNSLVTSAVQYLYNGATLDMARSGASGGLVVEVVTRAWEDLANGWINAFKSGTAKYTPAKVTTTDIGAAATAVWPSTEVAGYPNCSLFLRNVDAASPFTDAAVYVSPDGAGTCGDVNWVSLTWTLCDILPITQTCVYTFVANSYRYMCATVTGAGGALVDVDAFLVCNAN